MNKITETDGKKHTVRLPKEMRNIYFTLLRIKEFKDLGVMYREDQIKRLALELKWKGTGVGSDPFIVNSGKLPKRFRLSNSNLFINVVNCEFTNVIVDACQNISFEKCTFEILAILRSSSIIVNQSSISKLGLGQSSNNHFEECTITDGFNLNNESNIFTDCIFNKKVQKVFLKDFNWRTFQEIRSWVNLPKFVKQLPYFIVTYAVIIICLFFIYGFNSISMGFDWIFIISVFFCLIALYLILARNLKHGMKPSQEDKTLI